MKFLVVGSSKETGARMTLEFEALSKAAAERKAQQAGMAVNRVEVLDEVNAVAMEEIARKRGGGWVVKLILLAVVVVVVYFVLRRRGIIG